MRSQRSNALTRPAIAISGRQLVPIENAYDEVVIRNEHQLSYGIDDVRRGGIALASSAPWQSQFGVNAAHPMDEENDLGGFSINVSNDLVDQRPNDAFLEPCVRGRGRPDAFQIIGQGRK